MRLERALKTTILAVVVGTFSFTAMAADAKPDKKDKKEKVVKKDFIWSFSNCRDPFKFRGAAAAPKPKPQPVVDDTKKDPAGIDRPPVVVPTTAWGIEAQEQANQGWAALYAGKYTDAVKSYSQALATLKKAPSSSAESRAIYQRSLDTAKRLEERKQSEQAFKARHLRITGIVWLQGSGLAASATINGKSYVAGNIIEGTDIEVTYVGREYIICKLRSGIRVKLDLNQ